MTAVTLTMAMFAENLQTRFHVHASSEAAVELELIELSEGRAIRPRGLFVDV